MKMKWKKVNQCSKMSFLFDLPIWNHPPDLLKLFHWSPLNRYEFFCSTSPPPKKPPDCLLSLFTGAATIYQFHPGSCRIFHSSPSSSSPPPSSPFHNIVIKIHLGACHHHNCHQIINALNNIVIAIPAYDASGVPIPLPIINMIITTPHKERLEKLFSTSSPSLYSLRWALCQEHCIHCHLHQNHRHQERSPRAL